MLMVFRSKQQWVSKYRWGVKEQTLESGKSKWKHLSYLATTRHDMTGSQLS